MARPGVTFNEVAQAAAEIAANGKNPTIEQVRLIIGSGSTTTLAAHLKRWKAEQASDALIASKENIPEILVATMKGLWTRVMQEADQHVEKIASQYESANSELKAEVSKYKINNQRWQKLYEQWRQEKETLQAEKITQSDEIKHLQQKLNSLETCSETQTKQLEEKQGRIEELNRLHNQVQTNLEHFRESAREQRLADTLVFEKREAILQQDIVGLKSALTESIKGRAEAEKLSAVLQAEYKAQQERLSELTAQHTQLQQENQRIKNEHIRLHTAHDALCQQESSLQEQYLTAQARILNLEKDAVSLEAKLQLTTNALKRAEDRAATLDGIVSI